jgi:protein involved in polysaccharide export with SLBB domain
VYYVITDGGGFGEGVVRLPITGNETVLDAISQIQGLSEVSSKQIWIARPAPAGTGCAQILDVHWKAIVAEGITTTNYQIFPGDKIYIKADDMITLDNFVAKVTAPVERILGLILLGHGVQRQLQFGHDRNILRGGGGGGF